MAANGQSKGRKGRVGPSVDTGKASRVSKAAGNIGSETMRVEQRSGSSATKQQANNNPVPSRRAQAAKQAPKKGAGRPVPAAKTPAPQPADSRLIGKMHNRWQALEPHHQQRFYSVLLLILSILLLAGLTFWSKISLLGQFGSSFLHFSG